MIYRAFNRVHYPRDSTGRPQPVIKCHPMWLPSHFPHGITISRSFCFIQHACFCSTLKWHYSITPHHLHKMRSPIKCTSFQFFGSLENIIHFIIFIISYFFFQKFQNFQNEADNDCFAFENIRLRIRIRQLLWI